MKDTTVVEQPVVQDISSSLKTFDEAKKSKTTFTSKSNRSHQTDFGTTRRPPWWENAPDDLTPFRRDFYTNVK